MIPEHIFHAYDIRGLVEGELSEDLAYGLGQALVVFLQEKGEDLVNKKIVVGRDMRPTSLGFQKALIKGVCDSGVNAVDVGLVSTPLFNFACVNYPEHAGGIMVTASHNPAEFNGFKITLGNGLPVGQVTGMDRIKELVLANNFVKSEVTGNCESLDAYPDYQKKIFSLVDISKIKPLKIVIDAGNGMADATIPKTLAQLSISVEYLYLEPDGTFPNHEANPLKTETLGELQKKVLAIGADFGFALDGDADRIGLVDETGAVVPASFVGGLIGLEVLKENPSSLMLYDLRVSRSVKDVWEKMGATTDITKVGHANIKKMMKDNGAIFASELSLHLYFHDLTDLESADLALLYILQLLSVQDKKLSELWQSLNKYCQSEEINFKVENKEEVLKKLQEKYFDAEINKLDGLLFTYPDYWFNVRASNTEPVLRLNLEANSKELMEEKLAEIKKIII